MAEGERGEGGNEDKGYGEDIDEDDDDDDEND